MSKRTFAARTFKARTFAARTLANTGIVVIPRIGRVNQSQVYQSGTKAAKAYQSGTQAGAVE